MPVLPFSPPDPAGFLKPGFHTVLIDYTRDVVDWHGAIRFLSLTALHDDGRDVPVEKLFVEPSLSTSHLEPEAMNKPQQIVRLTEAIVEHPRLVLLGDPGSGKSTVVNWICTLLRSPISIVTLALGPLVPLPLVLRELSVGPDVTWESLLASFLARPVGHRLREERARHERLEDSLLGRLLASGQAIVLLDGLDEIGNSDARRALRSVIHEAMENYPHVRWVLTSRVVGYEEVEFDSYPLPVVRRIPDRKAKKQKGKPKTRLVLVEAPPVATRLYLTPFDDRQVEQFATHWWAQQTANPHLTRLDSKGFVERLRLNAGLCAIARNPIMLTMAAQVFRASRDLPDGRAMLYREIARAYLGTLDKQRGLEHLQPIPHTEAEMHGWLAAIGWQLQLRRIAASRGTGGNEKPEILLTSDDLIELLAPLIAAERPSEQRETARLFLTYAGRRSGLLLPRGQDAEGRDLYTFAHLSFQEYFAGEYLRQRMSNRHWGTPREPAGNAATSSRLADVQGFLRSSVWREVFSFAFESISDHTPDDLLPVLALLLGWAAPENPPDLEPPPTIERMEEADGMAWRGDCARAEMIASLVANPHIALPEPVRTRIRDRVLGWELARQETALQAENWDHFFETAVLVVLLSRHATVSVVLEQLCRMVRQRDLSMLSLRNCTAVRDLRPLSALASMKELFLTGCTAVNDLQPLRALESLEWLSLNGCTAVSDLQPLSGLGSLEWLSLHGCTAVCDLHALGMLGSLKYLYLGFSTVGDLQPLSGLGTLEDLSLNHCTAVKDLRALSGLSSLQNLFLSGCTAVSDLRGLRGLSSLRSLNLTGCTAVSDLQPLSGLESLRKLSLTGCTSVNDLHPLSGLGSLELLDLSGCVAVSELNALSVIASLKELKLTGCTAVSEKTVDELRRARPSLKISGL